MPLRSAVAQGECHGDYGTELALALLPLANLGAKDAQAGAHPGSWGWMCGSYCPEAVGHETPGWNRKRVAVAVDSSRGSWQNWGELVGVN